MKRFHELAMCLAAGYILLFSIGNEVAQAQSLYFPPSTGNQWDTLSLAQLGWCSSEVPALYNYLGNTNTKAFIVLKDGKIVLEKYFGQFSADSAWYWASAGKCLTSFLVGIAQSEGLLHIDDTTSTYLGNGWTSAPTSKEQMIKIRNQLTMTSGLSDLVPQSDCTEDTCLLYLADAGTRWAYHNAPYTLLDGVLRSATSMSPNLYLQQKMRPITGFTGVYLPIGYNQVFFSTPRMMARFGLLNLAGGKWGTRAVLNDSLFVQEMTRPSQSLNPSYGYLWWLNGQSSFRLPQTQLSFPGPLFAHAPMDMYSALGKDGQIINVVPTEQLVVIRMGNAPGSGVAVPVTYNDSIWPYLNAVICTATSALENNLDSPRAKLYPNPFRDFIHLEAWPEGAQLRLRTAAGQLIQEGEASPRISTSHMPPGVYWLEIQSQGFFEVVKLIKH
jgi:CubicO group peptidase (beta-lactamase class C family)